MAVTDQEVADLFATYIKNPGSYTEAQIEAGLLAKFAEWRLALSEQADLSARISLALTNAGVRQSQVDDWWAGTATGGPNGDGEYPLTNSGGGTSLHPSYAKLAAMVATQLAALAGADPVRNTDNYSLSTVATAKAADTLPSRLVTRLTWAQAAGRPIPTPTRLKLLRDLYRGFEVLGIDGLGGSIHLFGQADEASSLINLLDPTVLPLTAYGDPDFNVDQGWKGGEVGQYLQAAAYAGLQDSAVLGVYVHTAPTLASGLLANNGAGRIVLSSGGTTMQGRANTGSSVNMAASGVLTGAFSWSRTAADAAKYFHDQDPLTASSAASTAAPSVLRYLAQSSSAAPSDARLAGGWALPGVTTGQVRGLHRLFDRYMTGIARDA